MNATGIQWTDFTWNPVTGCTKVSPGCDHCYADTVASRFEGSRAFPHGFRRLVEDQPCTPKTAYGWAAEIWAHADGHRCAAKIAEEALGDE